MSDAIRCPVCQGDKVSLVHREVAVNKTSFLDELSHCETCGERFYTYEQSMARSRARTEALQEAEGLPTPTEIRRIRASLDLSQDAFEQALGLGKKTVVRWERGTVPPSKAARFALWVAQRYPDVFREFARERNGDLPKVKQEPKAQRLDDEAVVARFDFTAESADAGIYPRVQVRGDGGAWTDHSTSTQRGDIHPSGNAPSREEQQV